MAGFQERKKKKIFHNISLHCAGIITCDERERERERETASLLFDSCDTSRPATRFM